MASTSLTSLHRQINRTRRRLFFQALLNHLLWCWAAVLLLTALWFVVQPFLFSANIPWLRWVILGGALALGTIGGVVVTFLRSPSRLEAALALDDRFGLKERVTTTLTLTEEQLASPAGQALLADVESRVRSLHVQSKFPLNLSWKKVVMPCGAAILAVLAVFFEPDLTWLRPTPKANNALSAAEVQEAQNQLNQLKKLVKKKEKNDAPKSKELKELEAEWKKLIEQQIDPKNRDQLREQTQKIRNLEEKMKNRLDEMKTRKQKKNRLEDQLEQLRAALSPKKSKDGPAKELLEALKKSDPKKAQEALEKLQKKLAQQKLDKEDLKKLEEQLRDMEKKLKRLTDEMKRKKDELEKEQEQGNLTKEEMEELEREIEQLQDLENLEKLLQECQNCARSGKSKRLSGKLGDLMKKLKLVKGKLKKMEGELKELKLSDGEMKELEKNQKLLAEIGEGLCRCLGRRPGGMKGGGPGGGRRPKGKEEATTTKNARQNVDVDIKGEFKITGFSRGGSFKKIKNEDVPATFRRTAQEAQRAIETQRITPDEAEILKGYYENLGGQKK